MKGRELKSQLESTWDDAWKNGAGLSSPRFPSAAVSHVLETICFAVAALMSPHGLGSGGNLVLQGPKGVGKTSILNALHQLLPRVVKDPSLVVVSVPLEAPGCESRDSYEDDTSEERSVVASLPSVQERQSVKDKRLVLLVDEVQYLYAVRSPRNQQLSFHLVSLAKLSPVLVIMTGSTATLSELLFHSTPPTIEQRGYANFNHTVF